MLFSWTQVETQLIWSINIIFFFWSPCKVFFHIRVHNMQGITQISHPLFIKRCWSSHLRSDWGIDCQASVCIFTYPCNQTVYRCIPERFESIQIRRWFETFSFAYVKLKFAWHNCLTRQPCNTASEISD